jgi:hypothetical protein
MLTVISRARRRPLALIVAASALFGACADEPVAPTPPSTRAPSATALGGEWVEVTVTSPSGGTEVGTLRWAANQIGSGGGTIYFDPSLNGGTIVLNGTLSPDGPMYIIGPDKGISITGNHQHRVIDGADNDGRVSLTNVTITKGYHAEYASAVRATSLYLHNSTVQDSRGPGSAIRVRYLFSAINSTISQNEVGGPALEYSEDAQVYITNSTIAYNAPGPGIGLYGAISPGYSLLVVLNNSIISNNGSPLRNCLSTSGLRYEGQNIANDWSCGAVGIGIGEPELLPLANNGGPTRTHAIPHTSPAYNTGVGCFPETDQRYVPRDAKCDVGAFEFNDFTKVAITIDPTVKVDATGSALLTGTLTCTRADSFRLALELHQDQKVRNQVVDVHAASDIPVTCGTTPAPWSASMGLIPGESFKAGEARATASTFQTPDWVTPTSTARAVKISVARK